MMIRIIKKLRVIYIRLLLPGSIYHIYSVISDKTYICPDFSYSDSLFASKNSGL